MQDVASGTQCVHYNHTRCIIISRHNVSYFADYPVVLLVCVPLYSEWPGLGLGMTHACHTRTRTYDHDHKHAHHLHTHTTHHLYVMTVYDINVHILHDAHYVIMFVCNFSVLLCTHRCLLSIDISRCVVMDDIHVRTTGVQ